MSGGPSDCPCASNDSHFQLYQEIESLKKLLGQRDAHIVTLETALIGEDRRLQQQQQDDSLPDPSHRQSVEQDKYDRLLESHKRLQRVNQGLEDKLLRVVDRSESERTGLRNEVSSLSIRLSDALERISFLEQERDQYKNDCLIAVQLLNSGRIDDVLQSLRTPTHSPTPKRTTSEHRTIVTTTFPPTSILLGRSPVLVRRTSDLEPEQEPENGNTQLHAPSSFLVNQLNQRSKSTDYSINFHDPQDSVLM